MIPYDLVDDYLPQLLRDPDRHLQHLAAKSPSEVEGFHNIIGDCEAIRIAVGRAQRAALRDVNVLILGESGTGKEMFARAIHDASYRKKKLFEAVNCAAIPKELLEAGAVRIQEGFFHGCPSRSSRGVSTGGWRDFVPGRAGRMRSRVAGQAPAYSPAAIRERPLLCGSFTPSGRTSR